MFKNKSGIFALALAMAATCFTGCSAEVIIPPLGKRQSVTRKTVVRNKERTNPK